MKLVYKHKRTEQEIFESIKAATLNIDKPDNMLTNNLLIKGENIQVMQSLLQTYDFRGKIDLVYIDPPFSTDTIFRNGSERTATVSSSRSDNVAYADKLKDEEYIEFIRERLIFIKEMMSDNASIYFHIDYKIGHYIKIIMDEIFGRHHFRNDITRIKCKPKNFMRKAYGNIKDLILFYTKTNKYTWNEAKVPLSEEEIKKLFKKIDKKGRHYTTIPLHAPGETTNGATGQPWRGMYPPKGRHWRSAPSVLEQLDKEGLIEWSPKGVPRKIIYADDKAKDGKKLQDIWDYKDYQYPKYPTEKNIELLKIIILASSNPGDLVFDCFCGSGTTLLAAQELGRRWIGIDNSEEAIKITVKRLENYKSTLLKPLPKYLVLHQEK